MSIYNQPAILQTNISQVQNHSRHGSINNDQNESLSIEQKTNQAASRVKQYAVGFATTPNEPPTPLFEKIIQDSNFYKEFQFGYLDYMTTEELIKIVCAHYSTSLKLNNFQSEWPSIRFLSEILEKDLVNKNINITNNSNYKLILKLIEIQGLKNISTKNRGISLPKQENTSEQIQSIEDILSKVRKGENHKEFKLIVFDELNSLIIKNFSKIEMEEFYLWKKDRTLAPNINNCIKLSNEIALFVTTSILYAPTEILNNQTSSTMINFFVQLGKYSIKKGNFELGFAISSAFSGVAISQFINRICKKDESKVKKFTEIYSLCGNFNNYRTALAQFDQLKDKITVFPLLAVFCRELTFQHDGNQKTLTSKDDSRIIINGDNIQVLAKIMKKIYYYLSAIKKLQSITKTDLEPYLENLPSKKHYNLHRNKVNMLQKKIGDLNQHIQYFLCPTKENQELIELAESMGTLVSLEELEKEQKTNEQNLQNLQPIESVEDLIYQVVQEKIKKK